MDVFILVKCKIQPKSLFFATLQINYLHAKKRTAKYCQKYVYLIIYYMTHDTQHFSDVPSWQYTVYGTVRYRVYKTVHNVQYSTECTSNGQGNIKW